MPGSGHAHLPALYGSQPGWHQAGSTVKTLLYQLLLVPFGTEFSDKEIINPCLGIAIKPGIGRACDKDIPDGISRNTVAISFSASRT